MKILPYLNENAMPMTFCLPTAGDERDYTKLALESLKKNTDPSNEIIVYIDSDNLGTETIVRSMQEHMPNVILMKNPYSVPLGLQRAMSLMIDSAKNDIVCYIQSDMVISKDADKVIEAELTDNNTILGLARIEPPLHPPSPDKITMDLGMSPETFNWSEFEKLTESMRNENRPPIYTNFAPFAIYKETWMELGGFDTTFRASREDSDFMVKAGILNKRMIQTWNAMVYHFTCISSRGKDWHTKTTTATLRNELQLLADQEEVKNFIRKWGRFGHIIPYRYNVSIYVRTDIPIDPNYLIALEPFFDQIILDDEKLIEFLRYTITFRNKYYVNSKFGYSDEDWLFHKNLGLDGVISDERVIDFNTWTYLNKEPLAGRNTIEVTTSAIPELISSGVLNHIQEIIHENEFGEFNMDLGNSTIDVMIGSKLDMTSDKVGDDACELQNWLNEFKSKLE